MEKGKALAVNTQTNDYKGLGVYLVSGILFVLGNFKLVDSII